IAQKLTAAGMKVIITARNRSSLEKAATEIGCDGFLVMDVTSPGDWETCLNQVKDRYGKLDVLVNNAGGGVKVTDTVNQTLEDIDASLSLNLSSVIYGSRIFGRLMKEKKSGLIINIASVCAAHAWPGWSVYAAAKAGVLAFSKGLYVELQPHKVRVTCLIPAAGSTDFMKHAGGANLEMKLMPEDIAEAAVYLCGLPDHVAVEEMTVWGIDQVVVPL
ncbi:MAG: SDR family oxidoreductase, partial [Spirochaetales bacterium]